MYKPLSTGSQGKLSNPNLEHSTAFIEAQDMLRQSKLRTSVQKLSQTCPNYPNHTFEVEQLIVNQEFIDESTLDPVRKETMRISMLAPDVIESMTDKQAIESISKRRIFNQLMTFLLSVLVLSMIPIVTEFIRTDQKTGLKEALKVDSVFIFAFSNIISTLFCSIYAFVYRGKGALATVYDPIEVMKYIPIALAFTIQERLAFSLEFHLGISVWKVLTQLRLLFTGIGAYFILKRNLTFTQWLILIVTTLIVIGYTSRQLELRTVKAATNASDPHDRVEFLIYMSYIACGIGSIIFTTVAGLFSELIMRKSNDEFVIQYGRTRFSGLICIIVGYLYGTFITRNKDLSDLRNWEAKYGILVLCNLLFCYFSTYLVKKFDSTWKTLASSIAMTFTYVFSVLINKKLNRFDQILFVLVLAISTNVLAFASSKEDERKIIQLAADIERLAL